MQRLFTVFSLVLVVLIGNRVMAGEPLFGYLYTTDLQPKGKFELEQWFTDREGQAHGHFHHLDMSTELEYGITDNFQVALYMNYMYADESGNSVAHRTEGIEVPYYHDPDKSYQAARFDGSSLEIMYRVLSPYLKPVGLAFYLEPEVGYYESGVEGRVIVQKNFLDDQLILDFNAWVELDREQESNLGAPGGGSGPEDGDAPTGSFSNATYLEEDLGLTYHFASNWYGGLEFRNHNEYSGWTLTHSHQDHTAFFLGPSVHYAAQKVFVTFAMLRQLRAIPYNDDQRAQMKSGRLYGDEHTTWDGIRLIVGFPFG